MGKDYMKFVINSEMNLFALWVNIRYI